MVKYVSRENFQGICIVKNTLNLWYRAADLCITKREIYFLFLLTLISLADIS